MERARLPNMALVGFMGAGKTTAGRRAAEELGLVFVDSDVLIAGEAGMSIPEIFAAEGEAGFRERERRTLLRLAEESGLVIATGGGAFMDSLVRRRLLETGLTVYLEAPFSVLWDRVGRKGGRPLLEGEDAYERAKRLFAERQSVYAQAHRRVDASADASAVARELVEVYRDWQGAHPS